MARKRVTGAAAARMAEEHLRSIGEALPTPVTRCSRDLRYLWVSQPYADWLGHPSEEIVGQPIVDVIGPEAFEAIRPHIDRVLAGTRVEYEAQISFRGPGLRWIHAVYTPTYGTGDTPDGWVDVVFDVDDRHRLEEEHGRLAAIVQNSDDAIVAKTLDGAITSWNPAAERIFGYRADEAIGCPITIIIPPDRLDEEHEVMARLRRGERTGHFDTVRKAKDGSLIDLSLTVSPILDAGGRVVGASKIARDITERKRTEAALKELTLTLEERVSERTRELEEINAELDAFGYTVSHDLRAPLRAMDGFAKALMADHADTLGSRGLDYARRIVEAAQRMDLLIQDLLAYSRLSRDELRRERLDLGDVVREALHGLEDEIRTRSASITIADPLGTVLADRATLRQIVTNLLTNGIKFVEEGSTPRVRIRSESRGLMERLWVEDNGIGIAPRYHAKIFRVFERLHGIETYPGTGIGLAIVRRGTERMGGRVGVESNAGAGAKFWIELPR